MVDHFLRPWERPAVDAGLVHELAFDRGDVVRIHMLGGINAEAAHAVLPQPVQIVGLHALHTFAARVDVPHGGQSAVPYLVGVGVVGDVVGNVGLAGVKVAARQTELVFVATFLVLVEALYATIRIWVHARVTSIGSVVGGAVHTVLVIHPRHIVTSSVVEHHIGHHVHTGRIALIDHAFQLVLGAETRVELVADRLVDGPPLRALHGFLRWRDLHVFHAFRPVRVRAFLAYGPPSLLECDYRHVGGSRLCGVCDGLRAKSRAGKRQSDRGGRDAACNVVHMLVHRQFLSLRRSAMARHSVPTSSAISPARM